MANFNWDRFAGGLAGGLTTGFGLGSRLAQQRGEQQRQQQEAQRVVQLLQSEGASPEIVQAAYSNPQMALQVWQREKANAQRVEAATTAYGRTPFGSMTSEQQGQYTERLSTGRAFPMSEEDWQTKKQRDLELTRGRAEIGAEFRRPVGEMSEDQAYRQAVAWFNQMGAVPVPDLVQQLAESIRNNQPTPPAIRAMMKGLYQSTFQLKM